jgi:RNA chaperone Hfq
MAQADTTILQGTYLNDLRKQRRLVQVYLVSGVRMSGLIVSFDQYVLPIAKRSPAVSGN